MTLLHYALPGNGNVLGHEFIDHFLDAPEEVSQELLRNPLWREATEDEKAAQTAEKPARKARAQKVTHG